MSEAKKKEEIPPDAAPGEYGPITYDEFLALPEDVRKRRTKRVYEKYVALRGTVDIEPHPLDLRGRNR